ncbi:MAG: enoyl-CoA hydratase/isomerase family protein [Pirellulales bacterium]|nr:enoyl-CoA hydratase/isomerase family protein [Pirellulales bacterium]
MDLEQFGDRPDVRASRRPADEGVCAIDTRGVSTLWVFGDYSRRTRYRPSMTNDNYRHLRIEEHGQVCLCILSNPPEHTLNAKGMEELHHLLDDVERRNDVRVLAFTGAGKGVFIKHYELRELAYVANAVATGQMDAPPSKINPLHQLILRLRNLNAIVVAGINGNTAGGGFEFSLGCDLRVMAQGDFEIGLPETRVGIIPGSGGTQLLPRLIGASRAVDLLLHARLMSGPEAVRLGVINKLLPFESFREELLSYCLNLAARAPIALQETKKAIYEGFEVSLEESLAVEHRAFYRTLQTKDAARAIKAQLDAPPGSDALKDFTWTGE